MPYVYILVAIWIIGYKLANLQWSLIYCDNWLQMLGIFYCVRELTRSLNVKIRTFFILNVYDLLQCFIWSEKNWKISQKSSKKVITGFIS